MVAPHEREVVIRIKLEPDTVASARAVEGTRQAVRAVQQEATRASRTASTETRRTVEQSTRATDAAMRQMERHQLTAMRHWATMGTQFSQLTSSAARLARGIGMVFIANQKDREKFMESLVKIIGYTDILAGGVNMLANLTRMWTAYSAAVQGAAVSHTALNAARGGGIAATIAAGGGIAPTIVNGRQVNYVPMSMVGAGAVGAGGGLATVGAGLAAFLSTALAGNVAQETWQDFRRHGFMGGATPGTLSYAIGEREAGAFEWISRMFGGRKGLAARMRRQMPWQAQIAGGPTTALLLGLERLNPDPYGTQAAEASWEAIRRRRAIEQFYREGRLIEPTGRAAVMAARSRPSVAVATWDLQRARGGPAVSHLAALDQMQRALRLEHTQVNKGLQERIKSEREVLNLLRQQVVEVGKQQRAAETWIGADPMQRAQLQSAKARFQAGAPTDQDLRLLSGMRGMGIGWLDTAYESAVRQKLMGDPRARKFLGEEFFQRFAKAPTQADLKVQVEERELQIKLIAKDIDAEAAKYAERIAKLIGERDAVLREKIVDEVDRKLQEFAESGNLLQKAVGGD